MRTAVDGLGSDALQLLASSSQSTEATLAALINDLGRTGGAAADPQRFPPHRGARRARGHGMFLLEHRPPQLHVVLATRTESPLPLACTRGQLGLADE